jgi:dipeptidyl aminopeptidase/acylaminoacyl peptidase
MKGTRRVDCFRPDALNDSTGRWLARLAALAFATLLLDPAAAAAAGLESRDLFRLRSVGEVQISPDGTRIAYEVLASSGMGPPASQMWLLHVGTRQTTRLGSDRVSAAGARFSPDSRLIAYLGRSGDGTALYVARSDGSNARLLAPIVGTNHPLPSVGERIAWAPDSGRIAFVSAVSGPETESGNDPVVVTRYLYKPTAAGEAGARFNDNRRLHVFVVDLASSAVRQLTQGSLHEHSLSWSPLGDEIAFISNRAPDPDRVFNNDVFAVRVADASLRRLTDTKSAEYAPAWSPEGKRIAYLGTMRPLTSSETSMEDDHFWIMDKSGASQRQTGAMIDNRQGPPRWSTDGGKIFVTVQERGTVRLYTVDVPGEPGEDRPELQAPARESLGTLGSWSIARNGAIAYALTTPGAPAELYLKEGSAERRLTSLGDALPERSLGEVESFTFKSFDGTTVEAFLTRPVLIKPGGKHPLVVMIHGGPHAQQGPAFNPRAQIYASQGWATLMVNYRGSTGYGQRFADLIFKDQNGGEAKDVLAGVDAALARHPWLDASRLGIEGGSYGGQLTNWLITQTDRFKAAIPIAGISNLVSFNYTAYYHDYLAVEFGAYPHEGGLMDTLWARSPLRHVARVKTPVMLVHGENDNDVPIAEAEQLFIALKDVGVETVMVRYPREGHGIRETGHVVDLVERSVAWYKRHFSEQP